MTDSQISPGAPLDPGSEPSVTPATPVTQPLVQDTIPVPPPPVAAVECPGCGAKLRNISTEPGAKIRCLNCGTRFVAVPSTPSPAAAGSATATGEPGAPQSPQLIAVVPPEEKPRIREPKSAGYWILRIPAMVLFLGGSIFYVVMNITYFYMLLFERGGPRGLEMLMPPAYLLLIPIITFFFFAVTRSLARIEAGILKVAWKSGLVREAVPMVQGSSLPYILPLAAGPFVLFLAMIVTAFNSNSREALPMGLSFGVLSVACFVLAFMADDLRQFLWRQHAIAESCAQSVNTQFYSPSRLDVPVLGLLLAAMLCSLTMMFLCFFVAAYSSTYSRQQEEAKIFIMVAATMLGTGLTFFLLGRNFGRATEAWWSAAMSNPEHARTASSAKNGIDGAAAALRAFFYVFIFVGWMFFLYEASRGGPHGYEMAAFVFFAIAGTFLCLVLTRLYASVRSWRAAQQQFWLARRNLTTLPKVPGSYGLLLGGTFLIVGVQTLLFLAMLIDQALRWRFRFSELIAVLLASFVCHMPTIWLALMTREFVLTEQMTSLLKEAPAQAATTTAEARQPELL